MSERQLREANFAGSVSFILPCSIEVLVASEIRPVPSIYQILQEIEVTTGVNLSSIRYLSAYLIRPYNWYWRQITPTLYQLP